MEKKILKDLYCFQCSLQFEKKSIYDMHLRIIHKYVSRTDSFLKEIKHEPEEVETQIEVSPNMSKKINTFACNYCEKKYKTSMRLLKQ